jgi:hypothetical protein
VSIIDPSPPDLAPARRRRWRMGALRRRFPRATRAVRVGLLAGTVWLTFSLGQALMAPGTDSVAARLAGWARGHGLGVVVLQMEKLQYRLHPPVVGGAPPASVLGVLPTHRSHVLPPLRPFARPALAGEGQWRTLVRVHGQPAVRAAFLRPDARHTSYLTGVAWMDPRLLSFSLHPGFQEPGGTWPVPDWVAPADRRGLVATWNGGFRLADAHGGFYLDGRTAGSLVDGAASEVFYRDGSMRIGRWNRQVHMTPGVVGVRQNLGLLIDHGTIAPNVDASHLFDWGLTLGGAYYIFRSGVGITRQGDIVYVSGDALSVGDLARILKRAGCVRAMELDINPAWVSFMTYRPAGNPDQPRPTSLLPDYQRPADRYYTHTSRDFVAVHAR